MPQSHPPATWSTPREAVDVLARPRHLRRTVGIALVVGTLLFVINQLDVVLAGQASTSVLVKGLLTYLVPFAVSNYGILVATHAKPAAGG